ncbi:PH domain-containing protein [Plasmodiophora brassicae]
MVGSGQREDPPPKRSQSLLGRWTTKLMRQASAGRSSLAVPSTADECPILVHSVLRKKSSRSLLKTWSTRSVSLRGSDSGRILDLELSHPSADGDTSPTRIDITQIASCKRIDDHEIVLSVDASTGTGQYDLWLRSEDAQEIDTWMQHFDRHFSPTLSAVNAALESPSRLARPVSLVPGDDKHSDDEDDDDDDVVRKKIEALPDPVKFASKHEPKATLLTKRAIQRLPVTEPRRPPATIVVPIQTLSPLKLAILHEYRQAIENSISTRSVGDLEARLRVFLQNKQKIDAVLKELHARNDAQVLSALGEPSTPLSLIQIDTVKVMKSAFASATGPGGSHAIAVWLLLSAALQGPATADEVTSMMVRDVPANVLSSTGVCGRVMEEIGLGGRGRAWHFVFHVLESSRNARAVLDLLRKVLNTLMAKNSVLNELRDQDGWREWVPAAVVSIGRRTHLTTVQEMTRLAVLILSTLSAEALFADGNVQLGVIIRHLHSPWFANAFLETLIGQLQSQVHRFPSDRDHILWERLLDIVRFIVNTAFTLHCEPNPMTLSDIDYDGGPVDAVPVLVDTAALLQRVGITPKRHVEHDVINDPVQALEAKADFIHSAITFLNGVTARYAALPYADIRRLCNKFISGQSAVRQRNASILELNRVAIPTPI